MCRPMPIKGLPDKDDYGRKTLFSRRVAWSRAETWKSQLPLIIVAATAVSLVIIYFVYQGLVRSKCDSIFEQTANRLSGNLEFIKIKGELVLGREKVQELTRRFSEGRASLEDLLYRAASRHAERRSVPGLHEWREGL